MGDNTNTVNKQQGTPDIRGKVESERKQSEKIEQNVREEEKQWPFDSAQDKPNKP